MSLVLQSTGGGSITINEPTTASNFTQTLPAVSGQVQVQNNMPAFSYYQSVAQTLASGTFTKITFTTSEFDTTGGMYASSRFTPTVAGYYQVSAGISVSTTSTTIVLDIYKNGSIFKRLTNDGSGLSSQRSGSALINLNGSTDYIEIYAYFGVGQNVTAAQTVTYFQAVMVRTA
jgi:hypothetical protein